MPHFNGSQVVGLMLVFAWLLWLAIRWPRAPAYRGDHGTPGLSDPERRSQHMRQSQRRIQKLRHLVNEPVAGIGRQQRLELAAADLEVQLLDGREVYIETGRGDLLLDFDHVTEELHDDAPRMDAIYRQALDSPYEAGFLLSLYLYETLATVCERWAPDYLETGVQQDREDVVRARFDLESG